MYATKLPMNLLLSYARCSSTPHLNSFFLRLTIPLNASRLLILVEIDKVRAVNSFVKNMPKFKGESPGGLGNAKESCDFASFGVHELKRMSCLIFLKDMQLKEIFEVMRTCLLQVV